MRRNYLPSSGRKLEVCEDYTLPAFHERTVQFLFIQRPAWQPRDWTIPKVETLQDRIYLLFPLAIKPQSNRVPINRSEISPFPPLSRCSAFEELASCIVSKLFAAVEGRGESNERKRRKDKERRKKATRTTPESEWKEAKRERKASRKRDRSRGGERNELVTVCCLRVSRADISEWKEA